MVGRINRNLAQQIVETVADACGKDVNFIRTDGMILASTNRQRIGTYHEIGRLAAQNARTIAVDDSSSYPGTRPGINMPIQYHGDIVAVVGISGNPEEVRPFAHLAERITHLLIREQELNQYSRTQADKAHYIIQTLLGTESFNHEYLRQCLADFSLAAETTKRLVMIRIDPRYNVVNISMLEPGIRSLFEQLPSVYTYNYPNEYLALIDEQNFRSFRHVLEQYAADNQKILKVCVGKAADLFNFSVSYETAVTAWQSIRSSDASFCAFDDLTLEILLAALSETEKEEFRARTIRSLSAKDQELLLTYFDADMSLKRTSEATYMHKNTVQYQLNRIAQNTGLNPRKFRDAVLLYLGLRTK